MTTRIPSRRLAAQDVLAAIRKMQDADVEWQRGRLFNIVSPQSEGDLDRVLKDAYLSCFYQNGLSPDAFPSLARMQREVIQMTADLLGHPGAPGNLTSGGSESNFLAVKTARDRARAERPDVGKPEIILPASAHPSLSKAAHYLGLKEVRVPVDDGQQADVERMKQAIGPNTIVIVGSAPSWPHGVIDPIEDLATLAKRERIMLHVDACVGGFVLPFAKRLGRSVPPFDFSVAGVTSMSADIHKFGYAPKGASVILYRDEEMYNFQPFTFDNWTGGTYSVPTFPGSRPGGAIAAAWAVLNFLGFPGYLEMTETCLKTTERLIEGIRSIRGLFVLGNPQYNLFAFESRDAQIGAIWTGMRQYGWRIGLQGKPPSTLHLTVAPSHARVVGEFLEDLKKTVELVTSGDIAASATVARYN